MASGRPETAAMGTREIEPRLSQDVCILAGPHRVALPAWSRWLVDLGAWIAGEKSQGSRTWVVVTVPARDYAAVFVALGVVVAAARAARPADPARHFDYLRALPAGTPVRYRSGKRDVMQARLEGCGPVGADRQLAVKLSGGYSRLAARCSDIEPLAPGEIEDGQRHALADNPEFVEAALNVSDAGALTYRSRMACLLVGTKRSLHADLQLPMAAGSQFGTLQDLVRCRSLLSRDGDGCLVDAASSSAEPEPGRWTDPGVIVLDGPPAILRWRSTFRQLPTACIVDRWHPSARAASDAVMSERARSTADVPVTLGNPPAGIEVLGFSFGDRA